tara:strand:+ start:218 stop:478 length:261 start_codon:yes stop_codon:yes gene_type:complete
MTDKKGFKVVFVSESGETKRIKYRNSPEHHGLAWYMNKSKSALTQQDVAGYLADGWRIKTNNLRRFKETFFPAKDTGWPVIISDEL